MKNRRLTCIVLCVFLLCVLSLPLFACRTDGERDGLKEEAEPTEFEPCDVRFSLEAGAYPEKSKKLVLSAPSGYSIYYTTDGSLPDTDAKRYRGPIKLTAEGNHWADGEAISRMIIPGVYTINEVKNQLPSANIIRAVAVAPDGTAGAVSTKTYFMGQSIVSYYHGVMVISIVLDEASLLDYDSGILAAGASFEAWKNTPEAPGILADDDQWWLIPGNYSQKGKMWERPASIEIFDGSDTVTLQQDGGIRVKGGVSRSYNQKSFNLYFKKSYGAESITYMLFPSARNALTGETIEEYNGFTLRNGGNDTNSLKFKDGWIQSLLSDMAFSTQQDRPAILFLNGEYWGIYNLNDKLNSKYIEEHYGVEDLLMVKEGELEEGKDEDFFLYEELMSYKDADFSRKETWDTFRQIMDVQSMVDYYAAEIYIGNYDWDQMKNICLWRSIEADPSNPFADGRWRYIMYDTEYSSSMYGRPGTEASFNSLEMAMQKHPLFAAALYNPEFREMFKTAIKGIGAQNFAPEVVNQSLDSWAAEWKPFMPDYYTRFTDTSQNWDYAMKSIKAYFGSRYANIIPVVDDTLPKIEYEETVNR